MSLDSCEFCHRAAFLLTEGRREVCEPCGAELCSVCGENMAEFEHPMNHRLCTSCHTDAIDRAYDGVDG